MLTSERLILLANEVKNFTTNYELYVTDTDREFTGTGHYALMIVILTNLIEVEWEVPCYGAVES